MSYVDIIWKISGIDCQVLFHAYNLTKIFFNYLII